MSDSKTLYAGKLPSTKKPGETVREKLVRRLLRAAKALDAANAKPAPREGEREGYQKKFDGTVARLRDGLVLLAAKGEDTAPTNDFEKIAFELAGVIPAEKPAKAPARRKAPAKSKPAKAAPAPEGEKAAEEAEAA